VFKWHAPCCLSGPSGASVIAFYDISNPPRTCGCAQKILSSGVSPKAWVVIPQRNLFALGQLRLTVRQMAWKLSARDGLAIWRRCCARYPMIEPSAGK